MAYVTLPSSGGATFRIYYTETPNASTNKTVVKVTEVQVKLSSYVGQFYFSGSIKIGGTTVVSMNATNGTHYANINAKDTFYKVNGSYGSVTITHDADGTKTVAFATVGVQGYYNGSKKFSSATSKDVPLTRIYRTFTLTISAGTGSTITVNRTSSPGGGSTGSLTNGATIYYSDVLSVTTTANTGYDLVTQPNSSYTVTAAITLSATASLKTYSLTITDYSNGTVEINRTSSSGGSTGILSNGATLYYGDKLTISYSPNANYKIKSATLNNIAISSGSSHTVTEAVVITIVFNLSAGVIYIDDGTSLKPYHVYIDNGTEFILYSAYVDNGSSWNLCS